MAYLLQDVYDWYSDLIDNRSGKLTFVNRQPTTNI